MKENNMNSMKNALFDKCTVTNYKGQNQVITICAIPKSASDIIAGLILVKEVDFGYSVQNAIDKYDEDKSKLIAYNRADNYRTAEMVMSSNSGTLNNDIIRCIMKDKLNYWQHNLGVLIPGYDEAEEKYLDRKAAEKEIKELTYSQLSDIQLLATATDEDIAHAKKLNKYIKDENNKPCKDTPKEN